MQTKSQASIVLISYFLAFSWAFQGCGKEGLVSTSAEQSSYLSSNVSSTAATKFTILEDTPLSGSVKMYADPDSRLKYIIATQPTLGNITSFNENTAEFSYAPNANANGADFFEVVAIVDKSIRSEKQKIEIQISQVNDAPVAVAATVAAVEDTVKTGNLVATDIETSPLTFALMQTPTKGIVVINPDGSYVYTPAKDANGADSFSFRVSDGELTSLPATINLNISAVNDLPVAAKLNLNTNEDVPVNGVLSASDVDGDAIVFSIVTMAQKGTVVITNINTGAFTYTPVANATGSDTFTFRAKDAIGFSNTETVSVNLQNVNDAPIAQDISVSTNEDISTNIQLVASDVDGDALSYKISQPINGTILNFNVNAGTLMYVPRANYNGADSFTYSARDGSVDSAVKTVTIAVVAVNDAPVAQAASVSTNAGSAVLISPVATDIDSATLTYSIVSQPSNGSATIVGSKIQYSPNSGFLGGDVFTYKANDGKLDSNLATISVNVIALTTGSATLSWDANTEVDLANYNVYFGTDPANLSSSIKNVAKSSNVAFVVNGLNKGNTYYFAVTAVSPGGESSKSGVVSKLIN